MSLDIRKIYEDKCAEQRKELDKIAFFTTEKSVVVMTYTFDKDTNALSVEGKVFTPEEDTFSDKVLVESALADQFSKLKVEEEIKKTPLKGPSKLIQYPMAIDNALSYAQQVLYNRTKKYIPTYMIVSAEIVPMLAFCQQDFEMTDVTKVNGSYQCGTYKGLDVLVSPGLEPNECVFGFKSSLLEDSSIICFENDKSEYSVQAFEDKLVKVLFV